MPPAPARFLPRHIVCFWRLGSRLKFKSYINCRLRSLRRARLSLSNSLSRQRQFAAPEPHQNRSEKQNSRKACKRIISRQRFAFSCGDAAHHIIRPFPPRLSDVYFASRPSLLPFFAWVNPSAQPIAKPFPPPANSASKRPPKGGASRRKREEGREWDRGADCHFNNKAQHCDPARLGRERGKEGRRPPPASHAY